MIRKCRARRSGHFACGMGQIQGLEKIWNRREPQPGGDMCHGERLRLADDDEDGKRSPMSFGMCSSRGRVDSDAYGGMKRLRAESAAEPEWQSEGCQSACHASLRALRNGHRPALDGMWHGVFGTILNLGPLHEMSRRLHGHCLIGSHRPCVQLC